MGKRKGQRKRLEDFVSRMSEQEAREQLVLAYRQMERCIGVLRGENTQPVNMLSNGEDSWLELFYLCRKVRKELDLLESEDRRRHDWGAWPYIEDEIKKYETAYNSVRSGDNLNHGTVVLKVDLDISDVEDKLLRVNDMLDNIHNKFK